MNKIYRRLWSTARQCWVVASELTAPRGKAASTVLKRMSICLLLLPGALMAQELESEVGTGEELEASLSDGSLPHALRLIAQSNRDAQLYAAAFAGQDSLQLGVRADAAGSYNTAVGPLAHSKGYSSSAFGHFAVATGQTSTAVGAGSAASGGFSLALGHNARASGIGSIALGFDSVASDPYSVSVGNRDRKRKIVNVEEGAVNRDSYEVVNGRQLQRVVESVDGVSQVASSARDLATSLNQRLDTASRALATGSAIDDASKAAAYGGNALAVGASAIARGTHATALGMDAQATANQATALGRQTRASGVFSTAIGNNAQALAESSMGLGDRAKASHYRSVALGYGSETTGNSQVSVGNNDIKRKIVNMGDGALNDASSEAVTGKQLFRTDVKANNALARLNAEAATLGSAAAAEGAGGDAGAAVGNASKAYNNRGVALGTDARAGVDAAGNKLATAHRAVALGGGTRSGESSTAAGNGAQAVGKQAVAVGAQAKASGLLSTAMGYNAQATTGQATAIGRETVASGAYSTALGNLSKATAESAVALGDRAEASHYRSVALGRQSVTTADDQVSVGNASINLKRRIVNVEDGALSASSSEAVTGKQLFATNSTVTSVEATANAAKITADEGLTKATALGGLISGGPTGGMQLGAENNGSELSVRNKSGWRRVITGVHNADLSAGSTEAVTGQQLFATNNNVATARAAADSALGRANILDGLVSQVATDGNVRIGGENTGAVLDVRNNEGSGRVVSGVAAGRIATDSDEAISGKQLYATEARINAVAKTAVDAQTVANRAEGKADVVGGLISQKSPSGEMRLGGENTGSVVDVRNKSNDNRTLSGLADGAINASSTEAVTGKQLFGINEKVQANEAVLAGHGADLAAHSGRIADNRRDLDALRSEFEDFDPDLEGVVKFAADGGVDVAGGKLRGVAAGDISSATSTDAVNGGQLFATNSRISGLESDGRLIGLGREVGAEAAQAGDVGVAIGNGAQASLSGEGGTAVGGFSSAMASNSVALGRGALVRESAVLGFALGAGTEVSSELGAAIGAYAVVGSGGQGSVALGAYSEANEADVVSVGNSTTKRRIINVERGRSGSDGATVAQVGEVATLLGGGASVDANGVIIAPTYNIQGGSQNNVGDALAALDSAVVTADSRVDSLEGKLRSAFQDGPSVRADGLNQLVLAGANGSVLTNLADGRIAADSRDAVNGSQLFAAKQEIARNRSDLDDMKRRESISGSGAIQSESLVLGDVDFGGARLTGVSDGRVSSTSSDVVTGAQLFGTNERVSSLETSGRVIAVSSKNEWNSHAKIGKDSVAVGEYAAASVGSEGGTAVGHYARADSKNSVAIGESSSVSSRNEGGVAVGSRARADGPRSVAIGDGAWVFAGADNSVAVGAGSESMRSNEFSIGSYSNRRRLTHVASGIASYDAATAGQLRDSLEVLGGGSTLDAQGGVVAPTYRVQGGVQRSVGDALASLDSAVVTNTTRTDRVESQLRAVFQDSPTVRNDGLNQLTFAGANGMVLSNVANGVIAAGSRDAVNGGQLHSMQQQLNGRMDGLEQRIDGQPQAPQSRSLTVAAVDSAASSAPVATPAADEPTAPPPSSGDNKVVADAGNSPKSSPQPQADAPKPEAPTPQVDTAELEKMLARANEYSDGISREVDARLNKMDKRFNRMAAMSSAQSAMAMNTAGLNTYNRLGAGVGYSDGESAMAVGYQRVLNEKGSATFSLNGAFTNSGERSMGVGVGIGW